MKPQRIQRKRAKGWKMPPNTVSVTRPGIFGNPFTAEEVLEAGYKNPAEMLVYGFRQWLSGDPIFCHPSREARRKKIMAELPSLRGKNLACFCPLDQPCHADVLLELANQEHR